MPKLNNMTKNKNSYWQSIKELSYNEDSPCMKCLVNSTCSKSFINKSACIEFAKYIRDYYKKQK